MNYQTLPTTEQFMLSQTSGGGHLKLSDVHAHEIDRIWEAETGANEGLHNGKLLSFVSFNGVQLIGEAIEYKYYVAQRVLPELKEVLHIQPICISGITQCEDAVLIGKRAHDVFQFPGCYETVPSGGITPLGPKGGHINIYAEATRELKEETGIRKSTAAPLVFLYDKSEDLFEICLSLTVSKNSAQDMHPRSREYEHLFWLPIQDIPKVIKKGQWVPLSIHLLGLYL
jgi:ADP-ribose pyrophosphatase YjhB (NUDIX family)